MIVFSIFWNAIWKFSDDGGYAIASHLALSILLSLFPFLILTASLLGIWGTTEMTEQIIHIIFDNWPAETAKPIAEQITTIVSRSRGDVFSISSVVALFLASNGVEAARDGLNQAYKAKESRNWFYRRFQGILFVLIGAFLLICTAVALVAAPLAWNFALTRFEVLAPFSATFVFLRYGVALLVLFVALAAFHYFLPNTRLKFRQTGWGIAFTIGAIVVGSNLFAIYLREIANYTALYAGLAGTMVTIIYLYVISVLILFGGELNTAISEAKKQNLE